MKTKPKKVEMPLRDFVKEHKNLVKILKVGNLAERKREAKEQSQELKRYL